MANTDKLPDVPMVGMGATQIIGSDSYAYTIIRVSKSRTQFWMQKDEAKLVGGSTMSESQQYVYTQNKDGAVIKVYKSKRGWKGQGMPVIIGGRREYRDPSF